MDKVNLESNKELPNNYKEVAEGEQNETTQDGAPQVTDSKNTAENKEDLKQYEMPWIHLLDSNGELPSNYEEILENEQKEKTRSKRKERETDSEKKARHEALVKQFSMPWLRLIDSVTGELPKNYKQLLAEEEMQKKYINQNNDSKSAGQIMEHNSSKLFKCRTIKPMKNPTVTIPSKLKPFVFKTPKVSNYSTVRAKWSSKNKNPSATSNKNTTKMITNNKKVTIPSLKVESPLQFESHSRRQLFTSTPGTQQETSPKSPTPLADSVLNTTANFVELESLLQTPKVEKLNSLQKLEAHIKETEIIIERQIEGLNRLKEIYETLKTESSSSALKDYNKNKNLNLRVAVLKNTLDVMEKENPNYSAVNRYIKLKSDVDLLKTPNYAMVNKMRNQLSKKVMDQCFMLEDTPKK